MTARLEILGLWFWGLAVVINAILSIYSVIVHQGLLGIIYLLVAHWALYQYIAMVRAYWQLSVARKSNEELKAKIARLERTYPLPVAAVRSEYNSSENNP